MPELFVSRPALEVGRIGWKFRVNLVGVSDVSRIAVYLRRGKRLAKSIFDLGNSSRPIHTKHTVTTLVSLRIVDQPRPHVEPIGNWVHIWLAVFVTNLHIGIGRAQVSRNL